MNTIKQSSSTTRRRVAAIIGTAAALVATTMSLAAAQAPGSSDVSHDHGIWYFQSPSHNINCEGHQGDVWCAVFSRGDMVKMKRDGTFVVDPIRSDPAYDATVLAYGERVSFHGMRCASLLNGMKCVSKRTGDGVLISRRGARPIPRRG